MIEETKTLIKKIPITVYVASDGTEFTNKDSCLRYKESAVCAYRTLLKNVLIPIWGDFTPIVDSNDYNPVKNILDDILDGGRGECEYYTFTPKTDDDVKNFIASVHADNGNTRNINVGVLHPYTQLDEIKAGKIYLVSCYADSSYYTILECNQFTEAFTAIFNQAFAPKSKAE